MTATIDKRVVEMAFDNKDFERGVGGSLSLIDKLKRALNFDGVSKSFNGISDSASKVNLGALGDAANNVGMRFNAMGVIAITALVNITNAAIQAGTRIAKALIVDPIKTGLDEYETKLNSVQTILANTQKEGTNLETVTAALNQLNAYSDKTIYNFQQMARNIGTFTAAGVKLDTSVQAIKGIANLAAISGSNADQASTAMYQLSQALSTGTVRLMDWNSVVNAGMGGQVFQDAIMETARVHGVAIDQIIAEEGSFRDSLQRGWFSSEILTETLSKFTGDLNREQLKTMGYTEDQIDGIIKTGQTASDAATKVKTFTQLFGTLKEAAQSGWAQTWEIIIGDFEEARTFLTGLNNWMGGIIGAAADARNALAQGWSDLGGRTKLIEAFQNVLNGIVSIINPIKEAMKEIFPPVTAQQLFRITDAIANFTKKLILTGENVEKVKRIFKGLFAFLDIIKLAVFAVGKEFVRLLGFIAPASGGLLDIVANLGDFILKVRDAIKTNETFSKIMKTIGDTILLVAGIIGKGISAFVGAIRRFRELNETQGFLKAFSGAIASFFEFFKNLDFGILKDFFDKVKERFAPLGKLADFFTNSFGNVISASNPFRDKLVKIGENIREALSKLVLSILDSLSKVDFSKINFNKIFDNINAGLLGALLLSITSFVRKGGGGFKSLIKVFEGAGSFVENASGILASISGVLTGVKDIFVAWQQQIRANILLKIAGAIAILALSLIGLSLVDSEKLTGALASISLLFANLFGAMAAYEKVAGGPSGSLSMAKGIGAMIGLSVAVLILSGALVNLAQVDTADIIKGVLSIGALTGILVATSKALSGSSGFMIRGALSLIIFGVALRTIIGPLKTIGAIDTGQLTQGLTGLGVLFTELSLFMKSMSINGAIIDDMLGLLILGAAISDLSGVITALAGLDTNSLIKGLSVMGILLAELMAFSKMSSGGGNFVLTAVGMLVLSNAMTILADVLNQIGKMSIEELTVGLSGLGASLLILGVALNAMTGGIAGAASLLVAAAAITILVPPLKALGEMSLEQLGISLLAVAGVFTILGIAGAVLTPVIPTLLLLSVAMAAIGVSALAIGVGIGAFAAGIGLLVAGLAALASVGAAGGLALAGILLSLASVLPALATAFALAIISFSKVITGGAPSIFAAAKVMMTGFIGAITEVIPEIAEMMFTFVGTMLGVIDERLPDIINSGYGILIGFLSGIRDNIGQVVNVTVDVINAYLNTVAERVPELIVSGHNLIISFIDGLTASVEENMPRLLDSVRELSLAIIKGLLIGFLDGQEDAKKAIVELGTILINAFKERLGIASPSSVFIALALDAVRGLVLGLINNIFLIRDAAIKLATQLITTVKSKLSDMVNAGKDLVNGLAEGIKNHIAAAVEQAKQLALSVLNTIASVFDAHSDSRKMIEMGMFVDRGLAGGIAKFASLVVSSTEALGDKTLTGFESIISRISDSLNSDMDFNPTITPVLDMTAIEQGGSQIQNLLGVPKLNLSVASMKAASIKTGETTTQTEPTTQTSQPTSNISFTQINNSPKALSRIDIYRQTKNQLSIGKDLIGAT